ncbi:hypothetical protein F5887DRAFT_1219043 [Amanita rubescens]|nr:hypothetical protein F5887DRAFT_1219043 [Amanita rubescens]
MHGIPPLARFSKTSKRKRKRDVTDSESREDPLDRFFALLHSRIFSRIIATTCRLSRIYLGGLLLSNADASHVDGQASRATDGFQEASGDLRAGVTLLFERNARLLFTDPPSVGGITDQFLAIKLSELHASLALETVSELDKVIFGNSVNASAAPPSTVPGGCRSVTDGRPEDAFKGSDIRSSHSVHQRVERLAIKDAVWYLCHVMHVLLGGSNAGGAESEESPGGVNVKCIHDQRASTILLEAAQDILFRLVIRCRKEITKDKGNIYI